MKKQLLLAMTLVLAALTTFGQTLYIGGRRAPLDTLNNIWLCSVPQSMFGQDYTARLSFGHELTDLAIEGVSVTSGTNVKFEAIEGGKQYVVTAKLNGEEITGNITFTWLPIVELLGNFRDKYRYGTIIVSEPDSVLAKSMKARIKTRGRTTLNGQKSNYRIKLEDEDSVKMNQRLFGLRNDNCWILDAGQRDFLRVRNRVSTDLWLDMSRRPWYSDTLPNCHNGSRGQMVEVLLNGEYRGIYNMCEPIDRKQLKLKRFDEVNQEIHGELWLAYQWSQTASMVADSLGSTYGSTWDNTFEVKYPDWDEYRIADWTVLQNAVKFAKRADSNERLLTDSTGYYFDLPVMQDYFIFITALAATDNESKNIFYACHDITEHPRLTMTPWDLDVCLGQYWSPWQSYPDLVSPTRNPLDWIFHLPMVSMWALKDYHNDVVARYKELRKTVLNTDNLVNRYRAAIENLEACGAAAREEARWSGSADLGRKTLDLSAEMDYVEEWIRTRMAYLDAHFFIEKGDDILGDVNGDGEVNIADVNAITNIILGGPADSGTLRRADVNRDGEINIADVNAEIALIAG